MESRQSNSNLLVSRKKIIDQCNKYTNFSPSFLIDKASCSFDVSMVLFSNEESHKKISTMMSDMCQYITTLKQHSGFSYFIIYIYFFLQFLIQWVPFFKTVTLVRQQQEQIENASVVPFTAVKPLNKQQTTAKRKPGHSLINPNVKR